MRLNSINICVLGVFIIFYFPFQMNELPQPKFLNNTLKEMGIGTYENVVTVCKLHADIACTGQSLYNAMFGIHRIGPVSCVIKG